MFVIKCLAHIYNPFSYYQIEDILMEFNNFTKSSFNRFNKYEIGTIPMLNKNCEDLLKYFHIEYFREPILGLMYYLTI